MGEMTITYEDGTEVVLPHPPTSLLKAAGDGWLDYLIKLHDPVRKEDDAPMR